MTDWQRASGWRKKRGLMEVGLSLSFQAVVSRGHQKKVLYIVDEMLSILLVRRFTQCYPGKPLLVMSLLS